jgi:hypothetical protein
MPQRLRRSYHVSVLISHPEHLKGLGLIAAAHAALEDAMCELLGMLIGKSKAASAIFHSLGNHKARSDILRGVVSECVTDATTRSEILSLLDKAVGKARLRNGIMHSLWLVDSENGKVVQSLKRPATKNSSVIVNRRADELVELAIDMLEIGSQLREVAYRSWPQHYLVRAVVETPAPQSPPRPSQNE